jgi:hypothetical protein
MIANGCKSDWIRGYSRAFATIRVKWFGCWLELKKQHSFPQYNVINGRLAHWIWPLEAPLA